MSVKLLLRRNDVKCINYPDCIVQLIRNEAGTETDTTSDIYCKTEQRQLLVNGRQSASAVVSRNIIKLWHSSDCSLFL